MHYQEIPWDGTAEEDRLLIERSRWTLQTSLGQAEITLFEEVVALVLEIGVDLHLRSILQLKINQIGSLTYVKHMTHHLNQIKLFLSHLYKLIHISTTYQSALKLPKLLIKKILFPLSYGHIFVKQPYILPKSKQLLPLRQWCLYVIFIELIRLYFRPMSQPLVLQMKQAYPFGKLSGTITEQTLPVVKKTLHFETEEQYQMIQNMLHFLQIAKHPNLVNLKEIVQEGLSIQLYYEYAPLKLEKWVLDVNQEILGKIETELIEMAEHLTRASIKFHFDPLSLGLSENLSAKYFLNQFSIDMESQEMNFVKVKTQIREYFVKINAMWKEYPIDEERKPSASQSISTTGSISSIEEFLISGPGSPNPQRKSSKNFEISEKVENSKKKSLEVLNKFKKWVQK